MNVQLVITRVILFAGLSIGGWVAVFGGIADMRKAGIYPETLLD